MRVWNALKRPEWVVHRVVSKRAWGQIKELALFDPDPRAILRAYALAIKWAAAREDWTHGANLTMENLGSNSKLVQYVEKAETFSGRWRKQKRRVLNEGDLVTIHDGATSGVIDSFDGVFILVRLRDGSLARVYPDEVQRRRRE